MILLFYYYYHILFLLVIIVIVLSIIDVVYFNLSHFISYCSYYYDFWLRVACDVYLSHVFSFPYFLVNGLHFILALLMHVKNHFSLAIIVYIIIVIITTILFFSTLPPVIGGKFSNWIRAAWSTPTHWLLWISHRVSILFLLYFFLTLFFGDHHWGVDTLFHIYHMTSFNYNAKGARAVGLSCRCRLSNSQIVSSVQNMLERITYLWLCVSVLFVVAVIIIFFNSVFLLVCCLCFVFFFSGYFTEYLRNWSSRV